MREALTLVLGAIALFLTAAAGALALAASLEDYDSRKATALYAASFVLFSAAFFLVEWLLKR